MQHKISSDASDSGLGAVLLQGNKPVAYASRTLTAAEKNYAPIEKEMLAITFAAEKFHQYIYGHSVAVETDHKPLVAIFRKSLHTVPPRLQRFRLRLQKYQLNVSYTPGSQMYIADALSRAPVESGDTESESQMLEQEADAQIHSLFCNLPVSEEMTKKFKEATEKDSEFQLLHAYIQGKLDKLPPEMKQYCTFIEEIHSIKGLLFKGDKLMVPKQLRPEMLQKIHESHFGVNKCKARARESLYWPNMSKEIEQLVLSCPVCLEYQRKNSKEPLLPLQVPRRPWERVGADIFFFRNKNYLLLVDYYSKYPELVMLESLTSGSVIVACKSIFARHGVPTELISDNGPQFSAREFKRFSMEWDFVHTTTSPRYPQANGLIERNVQTIKRLLLKTNDPYISLLNYRNTPVVDVGFSPAQMLMGRRLKTRLPTSDNLLAPSIDHKKVQESLHHKQIIQKKYFDKTAKPLPSLKEGDQVLMEADDKWIPAKVLSKAKTPRSFHVQTNHGVFRRNRRHLKKVINFTPADRGGKQVTLEDSVTKDHQHQRTPNESSSSPGYGSLPGTPKGQLSIRNDSPKVFTRTGRQILKPKRLCDYV